MIVAPMAEMYYKITKTKPRFTRYSLETVFSNSEISSEKAKTELGYQATPLVKSITDTVRWWWDNFGITKRSLRL
jgi:dihydroflavonol-4-reductase